jgi:glucose-6-phosphate 1-epimerase
MSYVFCQTVKIDQLEAIKVEHPLFNATLLLQGAQLIEFTPNSRAMDNSHQKNLLWLSDSVQYKQGKPLRGGIPICWPWFGNLNKNPNVIQDQVKPEAQVGAHGFARSMPWMVHSIIENCGYVEIILELTNTPESKKIWPYEFNLKARFVFSKTLKVELITSNTGTESFAISQALHTYLPTSDITKTYIHNAHASRYIDALDNWKVKKQVGRVGFSEETDRLYFFTGNDKTNSEYQLRVESPNLQLILNNSDSQSAVIWNPWIDKSKRLSQFSPEDFNKMYCIETANVMSDHKIVEPQQQQRLSFELSEL